MGVWDNLKIWEEKAMAPHSGTPAWKIPWMEEPGGLQSMGSLRVGHDWATSLFTFMHWRRKWQPTPVFLPGESQGRRSLVGCSLWGRTESTRLKRLSSSSSKDLRMFWVHSWSDRAEINLRTEISYYSHTSFIMNKSMTEGFLL